MNTEFGSQDLQYLQDVLIFRLGRQQYSLPVKQVVEVLQMVAVIELPEQPKGVLGLINYRNIIMPLIDPHQVFGIALQKIRLNTLIVVARSSERYLAFIVDGVEDVKTINMALQASQPHSLPNLTYLSTIIRTGEETILMLDLDTLLFTFGAPLDSRI